MSRRSKKRRKKGKRKIIDDDNSEEEREKKPSRQKLEIIDDDESDDELGESELKNFRVDVLELFDVRYTCTLLYYSWSKKTISKWMNSGHDHQISEIIKYFKKNGKDFLERILKRVKLVSMKEVYNKHISKREKKLTRAVTTQEILHIFVGEESPLQKRRREKNILSTLNEKDFDEMTGFLDLCEITIPKDILQTIISYLPQTRDTVMNIGGSCKTLYILILSNWSSIFITKENLYEIPLLVLQSVRQVTLRDGHRKQFLIIDLQYIWKNLNHKRLRIFQSRIQQSNRIASTLRKHIQECRKKRIPHSTQNVEEVNLQQFIFSTRHWKQEDMCQIFPSVKNLKWVYQLDDSHIPRTSSLRSIMFTTCASTSKGVYESITDVDCRRFSAHYFGKKGKEKGMMKKMGEKFPNVKSLHLKCQGDARNAINIGMVERNFKNLENLTISLCDDRHGNSYSQQGGLGTEVLFPEKTKLVQFEVDGSNIIELVQKREGKKSIPDVYSKKVFSLFGNNKTLKKFRGDVLLSSLQSDWRIWKKDEDENCISPQYHRTAGDIDDFRGFLLTTLPLEVGETMDFFQLRVRTMKKYWKVDESFKIEYEPLTKRICFSYDYDVRCDGKSEEDRNLRWNYRVAKERERIKKEFEKHEFVLESFRDSLRSSRSTDLLIENMTEYLRNHKYPGQLMLCVFVSVLLPQLGEMDAVNVAKYRIEKKKFEFGRSGFWRNEKVPEGIVNEIDFRLEEVEKFLRSEAEENDLLMEQFEYLPGCCSFVKKDF